HAVAVEDLAFVGEVELRQGDVLPGDVAPHIEFGEVRDREHAHVLTGQVATVVDVPQLGALAAGVPAAEFVAQGDDPLLRPGLVLVPAGPTEDRAEAAGAEGVDGRLGRECVPGAVGRSGRATVVDVVLYLRHREVEAESFGGLITEAKDLGDVVTGVDVEEPEGDLRRPEGLRRQVEHGHGVLAAGEQQHGPVELGGDLTDDVDGLGFQGVEGRRSRAGPVVDVWGVDAGVVDVSVVDAHVWSPHSVLFVPAQRPARGSSPSATGRVQGWHPIEGYPCDSSGLTGTSKARA